MSEAKNTALGSFAAFRYSGATEAALLPTKVKRPLSTYSPAMIFELLVLATLVTFTLWDSSAGTHTE